ncbi:hypothetical protein ABID70_002056 [Clavibacter michiganensis]|uniref:hypothetical protein n=1 Tax=Clavibacter michiganensis TaxID=28447 RepID=UPI001AE577CD|nr:hypothetical protein [Clavibacter michiganensis]MBP2456533.1 hypothetical protein [Clavibacter michiganensis]MDQ0409103.1 hypothetical protein [Clavibacter michiganensis]
MTLLMEGTALAEAPAPVVEEVDAARADALLAEAFGFTLTHRGREAEVVMADVTLCCSTCCSCSSQQKPR